MGTLASVTQGITFYFDWEVALQQWLQAIFGTGFGVKLSSAVTMFGEELVMIAVLGFLYWCYDKEFGKFVGMNILVGLVATPMLKNLMFRKARPLHSAHLKSLWIHLLKTEPRQQSQEAVCFPFYTWKVTYIKPSNL